MFFAFVLGFGSGFILFPVVIFLAVTGKLESFATDLANWVDHVAEQSLIRLPTPISSQIAPSVQNLSNNLRLVFSSTKKSQNSRSFLQESQDDRERRKRRQGQPVDDAAGQLLPKKSGWLKLERTSRMKQLIDLEKAHQHVRKRSQPSLSKVIEQGVGMSSSSSTTTFTGLTSQSSNEGSELPIGEASDISSHSNTPSQGPSMSSHPPNTPLTSLFSAPRRRSRLPGQNQVVNDTFAVLHSTILHLYTDDTMEELLGAIDVEQYEVSLFPDNLPDNQCFHKNLPIWLKVKDEDGTITGKAMSVKSDDMEATRAASTLLVEKETVKVKERNTLPRTPTEFNSASFSTNSESTYSSGRTANLPLPPRNIPSRASLGIKAATTTTTVTSFTPTATFQASSRKASHGANQSVNSSWPQQNSDTASQHTMQHLASGGDLLLYFPSGLEKEQWFIELREASEGLMALRPISFVRHWNKLRLTVDALNRQAAYQDQDSSDPTRSMDASNPPSDDPPHPGILRKAVSVDSPLLGEMYEQSTSKPRQPSDSGEETPAIDSTIIGESPDIAQWFNAFFGRLFLGVYRQPRAYGFLSSIYTRKIKQMRLPSYFTNTEVSDIQLGDSLPALKNPKLVKMGPDGELWFDSDIEYNGGFRVEITTTMSISLPPAVSSITSRLSSQASTSIGVKLCLAVSVRSFRGKILAKLNKAPSNRIWYGFYEMPELDLQVEPVVSERLVRWNIINDIIEKRFRELVSNVFVLPNMDDTAFWPSQGHGYIPVVADPEAPAEPVLSTELNTRRVSSSGTTSFFNRFRPHTNAGNGSEVSDLSDALEKDDGQSAMSRDSTSQSGPSLLTQKVSRFYRTTLANSNDSDAGTATGGTLAARGWNSETASRASKAASVRSHNSDVSGAAETAQSNFSHQSESQQGMHEGNEPASLLTRIRQKADKAERDSPALQRLSSRTRIYKEKLTSSLGGFLRDRGALGPKAEDHKEEEGKDQQEPIDKDDHQRNGDDLVSEAHEEETNGDVHHGTVENQAEQDSRRSSSCHTEAPTEVLEVEFDETPELDRKGDFGQKSEVEFPVADFPLQQQPIEDETGTSVSGDSPVELRSRRAPSSKFSKTNEMVEEYEMTSFSVNRETHERPDDIVDNELDQVWTAPLSKYESKQRLPSMSGRYGGRASSLPGANAPYSTSPESALSTSAGTSPVGIQRLKSSTSLSTSTAVTQVTIARPHSVSVGSSPVVAERSRDRPSVIEAFQKASTSPPPLPPRPPPQASDSSPVQE